MNKLGVEGYEQNESKVRPSKNGECLRAIFSEMIGESLVD